MTNLLPIASGKGGVGKSSYAVNLATVLAQKGKNVILADFDFGGANLHTLLGLKNNRAGLGNFIYRQTEDFSSLLQETQIPGLRFVAGDCMYPGTANMDNSLKENLENSNIMEKTELKQPPEMKVVFYNDDSTTMDFVIKVLMCIFNKTKDEAETLMINVHENGSSVVGVYTYDIAVSLSDVTKSIARKNGFPLRVEVE